MPLYVFIWGAVFLLCSKSVAINLSTSTYCSSSTSTKHKFISPKGLLQLFLEQLLNPLSKSLLSLGMKV